MSTQPASYRTPSGRVLTEDELDALAAEAEHGYDVDVILVRRWQASKWVHQFTCGVDSNHRPLEPDRVGEHLWLHCEDCTYRQEVTEDLLRVLRGVRLPPNDLTQIGKAHV